MALDHYVSQVYLRNFNSPALDGMLYAIRKSDLKRFVTKSRDICRIEENSTNAYLKNDRAIEVFLKDVEPRWNSAVSKVRDNKVDKECIHAVAGFAAFVVGCSPAGTRIHSGPLQATLNSTAAILDAQGVIPKAPESLGEKSITELLADGTLSFGVDPKYPQAIAISNILHHTSVFGNSRWDILHNCEPDSPFFTSDFPVAVEIVDINIPINRIVPLAPDIAIRIKPDLRLSATKPDLSFAKFSAAPRRLKRTEVVAINRLFVQCAEDLVLYRDDREWIEGFVKKNRHYHVEPVTHTLKHDTGHALISTHKILARRAVCAPEL